MKPAPTAQSGRCWRRTASSTALRHGSATMKLATLKTTSPPRRCGLLHRRSTEIAGRGAELLFDAQQLVILRQAIGTRQRSRLDLAAAGGDGEIGDRRV